MLKDLFNGVIHNQQERIDILAVYLNMKLPLDTMNRRFVKDLLNKCEHDAELRLHEMIKQVLKDDRNRNVDG